MEEENKNSIGEVFDKLVEITAYLRSEEGCEWDRQQTLKSMRSLLQEETDEVLAAIEAEDHENLQEELGDLLLHVVFLSQIETEQDNFSIREVITGINEKLKRRHPHVFGDVEVENTEEILANWEKIKQQEKS